VFIKVVPNPIALIKVTVSITLLAPYFPGNKTYEVTGLAHGLYIEVLSLLETKLNFTTRLYKRQDGVWELATRDKNTGKFHASGMLTDLMSGNADMIVTSIAIINERSGVVDFLPPTTSDYGGLFILADLLRRFPLTTLTTLKKSFNFFLKF
jgi:hypothetical protein